MARRSWRKRKLKSPYSLRRWRVVLASCLPPSIFVSTHDYHKHSRIASPIFLHAHFCASHCSPILGIKICFLNGREELPNRSFYSIFFTPHGGRTRRLCGIDLHGCAVSLQNRTRRHNASHAAEQTAAPMCISDLCRSSAVSPPPTGGIGVWVLPASCVLVPKCDACAFLAQQEKPKTQPDPHSV